MKKRSMMKDFKKIIAIVVLFFCTNVLHALVDGDLDGSFNGNGFSALLDSDSALKAVAIQADGKIIAVGSSDAHGKESFLVARYNTDGSLDASFGSNGQVVTRFGANESVSRASAVVIQHDGKIVVAGFTNAIRNSIRWSLARYNPDGSLDESFFGGRAIFKGTVITYFGGDTQSRANALALTKEGKIIAAGTSHIDDKKYFALALYKHDGSLDETFNPEGNGGLAGTVRTSFGGAPYDDQAFAVAVQPNGKIVAGGSSMLTGVKTFALARYNSDGSLDNSFFSPGYARKNGTVVTNFGAGQTNGAINALLIQADGKIVAGGATNSNAWREDVTRFALARYDNRGILDDSFGGYGLATVPGTIITSFGAHEGTSKINALGLQADGKIVAAGMVSMHGYSHLALARYTADGSLNVEFNDGSSPVGIVMTTLGGRKANEIFALALQKNGDIVAAGSTDKHGRPQGVLARYITNDVLIEPRIDSPLSNSVFVNGSAIQINGKSQNPGVLKIYVDENLVGSVSAKGIANTWFYQLPPLTSGTHSIKVLEYYAGGNIYLASQAINLIVDQHPKAVNATIETCGLNSISGVLQATGASGNYSFEINSVTNGTVSLNGPEYLFTSSIASGQAHFTFKVTDSITHLSDEGTITVIVNEVPGAISAEFNACQNSAMNGSVADYVLGANAPFSFTQVGVSNHGRATMHPDGTFTFVPDDGFNGLASFTYQVTDAKGCISEPQVVYITVHELPIARDDYFTTHEAELLSSHLRNLILGGTAPYTFNLVECLGNCAITLQENGSFTLIPTVGFSGDIQFKYQVTDAHQCNSNTATVTVTVFESPVAANGTMSVCQNGELTQSLSELVTKGIPPYTYNQIGNAIQGIAAINTDGSFTFTPAVDFAGIASFKYQVTDVNHSMSKVATVEVVVNELPIAADVPFETCQDTVLNANLGAAVSGGTAPYSFTALDHPENGLLTLHENGNFEFIPEQGFSGIISAHYAVTDAKGCTSLPAHILITVWQNPTVQNDSVETCTNKPVQGTLVPLVSGGTPDYQFIVDQVDNGTVTVNENGSYIVTSALDFVGSMSVVYHAVDAHGCVSNRGTITVEVHPTPTVSNAEISTLENATANGTVAFLANGGIPPYTFNVVGESLNGAVILNADGSYQFLPTPDFSGQASFDYQVTDTNGCVSNTGSVLISVFQLPRVNDVALNGLTNAPITGNLNDLIEVGTAPFTFYKIADPINGTLVVNADGTYTFSPNTDFAGTESFQYMVTDAHNGTSNVATVTFIVNTRIEITEQSNFAACQDTTISGNLSSNVSGSVAPYTFALISQPTKGSVIINANGNFTYTPSAGSNGTDSFTFEVSDSLGMSTAVGAVQLTIYSKPQAQDSLLTTFENQTITNSVAALVSGGNEPYNFVQVDASQNGSLVLHEDGSFVFSPRENFTGIASFMYSVTDENNCMSNAAMVTIQVLELPNVSDVHAITVANKSVTGSVVNAVTAGMPPYTFTQINSAINGQAVMNPDGTFTFEPALDFVGSASFEYLITDAHNGTNIGTVYIEINDALIISELSFNLCQGSQLNVDLKPGVSGGMPPYTFNVLNVPNEVEITSEGSLIFNPDQNFNGLALVHFEVVDAMNNKTSGTAHITVYEAPQAQDKTVSICEYTSLKDTLVGLVTGGQPNYTFTLIDSAYNGTAKVNDDGVFTFIPSVGFSGTASFAYQVTDAHNCVSNIGTITIIVNKSPTAQGATLVTDQDMQLTNHLDALVTGGFAPYSFNLVGTPSNAQVILEESGSYTVIPAQDFAGVASFQYSAIDSNNCVSNIATVTIIVNPATRTVANNLVKRYLYRN